MVHTWMTRPCSPPPPPSPPPTPPLSPTGPPPPGSPGSSGPECGKDSLHTFPPLRWIQKGCGFGGGDRCSGNIYPSHGSPSGLTHVGVEMQRHSGNVQKIVPNCAESTIEQLSLGFDRRFESFHIKPHIICKERLVQKKATTLQKPKPPFESRASARFYFFLDTSAEVPLCTNHDCQAEVPHLKMF